MTHVIARQARTLFSVAVLVSLGSYACSGDGVGDPSPDAGPQEKEILDAGPPPPPPPCAPTTGGPHVLQEGETLTLTARCTSAREVPPQGFTFVEPPEGATFDSATATLTWTPALDQAGRYEIVLAVPELDEQTVVRIAVSDRWDDPSNVAVDPLTYTEEYGLPVLHLTTDPGVNDDEYTPATIVYRGHTYTGTEAKFRGSFSASFPKRSFTLKFTKNDKFNEPDQAGGFLNKRKVTVVSTFDDNSYLRQRLGYDLWNRLGPDHVKVQMYNAVLYLNGRYHGLYMLGDHVDDNLVESHGLSKDGNLYKARDHDANFRLTDRDGNPKVTLHQGYTKEEGSPEDGEEGAFDDLDALVEWVATSDSETFLGEIDQRLVRRDYEDWWLFVTSIMADDSASKNSYHFHDPRGGELGGPWRAVPWDLNQSFGQDWRTLRVSHTFRAPEVDYAGFNELFGRLLAEPSIVEPLRVRYAESLRGALDADELIERLDTWSAEIADSARRDEGRWRQQYLDFGPWTEREDFTTFEQEVAYVRSWIIQRFAYLEQLYPYEGGSSAE